MNICQLKRLFAAKVHIHDNYANYPMVLLADVKSSGTNGGTFNAGSRQTRDLNTVYLNTIDGCSLVANQIILPVGDFIPFGSAPAYQVTRHQARLHDVDGDVLLSLGTSELCLNGVAVQTRSVLYRPFSLTAITTVELQHQCQTTFNTYGFGASCGASFSVPYETYSVLGVLKYG